MITIGITYSVVTAESAEHGDYDRTGWERETETWKPGKLREALETMIEHGHIEASCWPFQLDHAWWTAYDSGGTRAYFELGEEKELGLHIDGATASTMRRIHKLLTGKDD